MNLPRAIRLVRHARGWRQVDVAGQLDISDAHVSLIEKGRRNPSLPLLQSFCDLADISVPQLFVLAARPEDFPKNLDFCIGALLEGVLDPKE